MISNKMDDMNFPSDWQWFKKCHLLRCFLWQWHDMYSCILACQNLLFQPSSRYIESFIFKFVRVKLRSHNDYNFQVDRYTIPRWPYCISGTGPLYIVFNKEITHNYENCKSKEGRFGQNIVCLYENGFPKN